MGKRKRIIIFLAKFPLHLIAIAVVLAFFWSQIVPWIYNKGFMGWDTPQFIYYVSYYKNHLTFPVASWDYQWFSGFPRVLDMTFIHFYLIQPLVAKIGMWQAIKIYPMISFGVFVILSYLIFYRLSKSILASIGITLTVVISKALYAALFDSGAVLSAISEFAYPLILFFLINFYKTKKEVFLYLAGLAGALGLFSHGATMMLFGIVPAAIFLVFGSHEGEKFITRKNVVNTLKFGFTCFFVGALAIWPQLKESLNSGAYQAGSFITWKAQPLTWGVVKSLTDQSVVWVLGISVVVALVFIKFRKLDRITVPLFMIFAYCVLWNLAAQIGLNPLSEFLFANRIMWFLPISFGALSAALLSKSRYVFKATIFLVVIFIAWPFIPQIRFGQKISDYATDIKVGTTKNLAYITDFIQTKNASAMDYRIRTRDNSLNNSWGVVYPMPLVEGYFHFYTKEAEPWQGWFYGTMSLSNYKKNDIPEDMAKVQSLFFIDWYAVKYLINGVGSELMDVAPHFYQPNDYVARNLTVPKYPGLMEIADNYASPIIEPVASPVVGFVGNTAGFQSFFKDLATLDLNTRYLIPIKVSTTISQLCGKDLSGIDVLVLYNFDNGGIGTDCGWNNLEKFADDGGKVWIETAGTTYEEGTNLPSIFPITSLSYGGLGTTWNVGGIMSQKIDFSTLSALDYRGTAWKLSYPDNSSIKKGSEILLTQNGKPIVVEGNVGKGKVIWSGTNFWYRPEEFRKNGMNEIKTIGFVLNELVVFNKTDLPVTKIVRPQPEKITITGNGFTGVVFKENYSSGWHASAKINGKEVKLEIKIAGPGLMYVHLPAGTKGTVLVNLEYKGEIIHWIAFIVSLLSLLVIIDLITGKHLTKRIGGEKLTKHIKLPSINLKSWWKEEDDQ